MQVCFCSEEERKHRLKTAAPQVIDLGGICYYDMKYIPVHETIISQFVICPLYPHG